MLFRSVDADIYTVVLQVTDDAGTTVATSQTVALPVANQLPIASFSSSCTAMTCNVDASGSTDPDGSVSGVSWDFGDGTSGTGATPSHDFGGPGTWTVELTVTDDRGGTDTTSVVVDVPPGGP